tara:strand:- start:10217 stop:10693 length:477 start_codon:yes stop_codon:yes gene_type:complete
MSELDDILLKLSQDREKNPSNKNRIELTDDLVIKKVAFDMVKVFGDQYNDLWKVEKEGDSTFLVRSSHPKYESKTTGDWSALSDYNSSSVTLSYRGVPICSFSSDEYGFSRDDVFTFKTALLDMAETDPLFVNKVVNSQLEAKASAIKQVFPDLFKKN